MRSLAALLALAWAVPAPAQAPPSASLWRVAAASLTAPAALAGGATAPFWNPAAGSAGNLGAGLQLIRTSDILGLSGVVGAVGKSLGPHVGVGVLMGRMDVRDLVRTTSSPTSTMGSIPVYDQMFGGQVRAKLSRLELGALVRIHDARFDFLRESGMTIDVGVRYAPTDRLLIAAATHFLPVNLRERANTDYYAGAEYVVARGASVAGLDTRVAGSYGLSLRASGDVEHTVAAAATFAELIRVDGSVVRETAFGDAAWRPGFGVHIQIGRYALTFARSVGINDVAGAYRVGLDVDFIQ